MLFSTTIDSSLLPVLHSVVFLARPLGGWEDTFEWKTAGLLCRAGAETNIQENLQVSLRIIFSVVDTQTAVLLATAEVWISAIAPAPYKNHTISGRRVSDDAESSVNGQLVL